MEEQYDNGTVFDCPGCGVRRTYHTDDVMIGDVCFCHDCVYDSDVLGDILNPLGFIAKLVNPRYSRICAERDALLEFYKAIMVSANDLRKWDNTTRDTTLTAWAADQMMRSSLSVYESVSHPLRVAMDEVKHG